MDDEHLKLVPEEERKDFYSRQKRKMETHAYYVKVSVDRMAAPTVNLEAAIHDALTRACLTVEEIRLLGSTEEAHDGQT